MLNALVYSYPTKSFYVYVTIELHDSFIIRFHQKWDGEEPYYDPNKITFPNSKDFVFERFSTPI